MTAHIHAKLMAQFAIDAQNSETPWERWKFKAPGDSCWSNCVYSPHWFDEYEYMRIPEHCIININGYEVPEPMREAPKVGTKYFVASAAYCTYKMDSFKWDGGAGDYKFLAAGICHLSEDDAAIHTKALLSFTKEGQ